MSFTTVTIKATNLCEPSHSEVSRISKVANKVKALVDKHVANLDEIVGVELGGSFAKGTWLKGDADIDLFFKVKPTIAVERFEELGRSVGLKALQGYKPRLRYSDHPYVEAFVDSVRINIVPCYDVDQGKWQSAADRSPFHTAFIARNFDDEKRRQARLLKKFLKASGIYGAEISTGGFSGYVSEVLVHKYGSLENVLRAAADWQNHQIVSSIEYDPDVIKGFNSPLIIIDPIDSRRNLGTAISSESVGKFMLTARTFLENPSLDFFKEKQTMPETKKLLSNVLIVEFSHKEKSPDIIWGQLKRSLAAIVKQLDIADFVVLRSACFTDEKKSAAFAFLLESMILPPYKKKRGPEVFRRSDTASFLTSKKKSLVTWIDNEMRVAMLVNRKTTSAMEFTRSLLGFSENTGVTKGLIVAKLQIYSGNSRKPKGVARKVVQEVITTERLIFG